MKPNFKIFTLIFSLLFLTACQQTNKVKASVVDVNTLLTNITIDALKNEDYQQAQRSITALIISDDDSVWDFIQSAIMTLPQESAMQVIEASLQINSVLNSSQQLYSLAKVLITLKETKLALTIINKSIKKDKNNLDARYWRARLLTVMKKYEKAGLDFQYITNKSPKSQEYLDQYASYLQETKQFSKAQVILDKQPETPKNLFKRIIFALQNSDLEKANKVYQTLKNLEVDSKDANIKNFKTAEAAYWLKKHEDSEKYYRKVLGGDNYLEAREMLSLILFDNEKYDEAIEILHQLQNAEQKIAIKAYRLESKISDIQGNKNEAIDILSRSLDILPKSPGLLYDRSMLYEQQNKIGKAKKDLLQIIQDDENNAEALNALGYTLADHDLELEKANEYINKALEIDPENSAILDSLGWVQFKLGRYEEAEKTFFKVIQKGINDPETYIHLYKTQVKMNKAIESKSTLNKAFELFPNSQIIKKLLK